MAGRWQAVAVGAEDKLRSVSRVKDGRAWRIATAAEVAWIADGTSTTKTITAAIPPVFEAYATLELPGDDTEGTWGDAQQRHDDALLALLSRHIAPQPWCLGYLDTGVDDIVFPDAPLVTLTPAGVTCWSRPAPNRRLSGAASTRRPFGRGPCPI